MSSKFEKSPEQTPCKSNILNIFIERSKKAYEDKYGTFSQSSLSSNFENLDNRIPYKLQNNLKMGKIFDKESKSGFDVYDCQTEKECELLAIEVMEARLSSKMPNYKWRSGNNRCWVDAIPRW